MFFLIPYYIFFYTKKSIFSCNYSKNNYTKIYKDKVLIHQS
nr:MAG TPA: hypothetical protein [Caudoviricetes sp.]